MKIINPLFKLDIINLLLSIIILPCVLQDLQVANTICATGKACLINYKYQILKNIFLYLFVINFYYFIVFIGSTGSL